MGIEILEQRRALVTRRFEFADTALKLRQSEGSIVRIVHNVLIVETANFVRVIPGASEKPVYCKHMFA
jgi:hypothetical protein